MGRVSVKSSGRAWGAFRIAVILIVSTAIGMVAILGVVSQGIDAHQRVKEENLVKLRLGRALEIIGEDLTTASTWNEAVDHMAVGDDVWFDRFLGAFYEAQHSHLATLGYDSAGRLFRISKDGAPAGASSDDPFARAARPLVDQVRADAAGRDASTVAMGAVRLKSAFVRIDGTVYLLGVSTVVRHTADGPVPAADPVVASFKAFPAEITPLKTRFSLEDVQFQPGDAPTPHGMAGVEVRDGQGQLLGKVIWKPERPGYQILTQAGSLMLLLLAVMIVGGAVLLGRMVSDVRRLRASEAALSAALERAEAANAAKTRFLSNISHELRTPLNGVLGMAEVIGADLVTPQQRDRLDILKASGQQQLRLIEELLDVVRLRDGAVTLETRPFRPENLLRRLASDYRGAAGAKGLKLKIEAAKGEWMGDAIHVEKLLAALTDNAIRFTSKGGVTLRAIGGEGLVLEVQDTGPGMAAAEVERLFEAFTQGDDSDTRSADGLGLGLTAAHGLAALMGGRIEVTSTPGQGSLFRVILPLQPVTVRPSTDAAV